MVTGKRQTLVNAGRRSSSQKPSKAKNKGHRPRTKITDAQIPFFGTPGQKRALARRKADKRAATAAARKRTAAKAKRSKSSAKRAKGASGASPRAKNPGGIVTLTLNKGSRKTANPKTKGKSMAAKSKAKKKSGSAAQRSGGRRSGKPKAAKPKRHNPARRRAGLAGLATSALFVIVGAVGSRLGTQALLGARNVGFMGYLGNAGAGVGLSLLARWLMKSRDASNAILLGTAVGIVLRVVGDYTPLGEYARAAGLGDYQVSNFVTPQRYVDAAGSAEVEVPAGWAPQIVAPANAGAPAGLSAGGYGSNLYGGGGLYS